MKQHARRIPKPQIQKKKKKQTKADKTDTTAQSDHQILSSRTMSTDHIMNLQRTLGNRATRRILRQLDEEEHGGQGNLQIGKANDPQERQADQIANHVVQSFDAPNQMGANSGQSSTMMRSNTGSDMLGGMAVNPQIESRIERQRGGGQSLDDNTRKHMEGAFGTDFSNVRIHTGKEADSLSKSVQAKAFTTGSDIFFSEGAYNPGNKAGQHLLAHELTHTIQQGQSSQLNRMVIQRADMETSGGTWTDKEFKSVMVDNMKPGALMQMHFKPNKLVESKKVALTQKVKKMVNGKNLDLDKKEKEKKGTLFGNAAKTAANRTTDKGEGHWDRMLSATNPVYGAKNLEKGQDISETPMSEFNMSDELDPKDRSNYQLGYRYNTWFGKVDNTREAILWDQPNVPTGAAGTEMIFEIAAVSIKGPQKGTFYGSVEWGFKIRGTSDDPQIDLVGPSIISQGTPSDSMMELAEIWNNKPTIIGGKEQDNTQMLTTNYKSLANDINLDDAGEVQKAIQILEAHMPNIKGDAKKNAKFELKFLKLKLKNLQD